MDKKTTGIVATLATVLLCGCPGLFSLCMGLSFTLAGFTPGANIDIGGSSDPAAAISLGLAALCLGLIFVIIPVVVGFLTLRSKPAPVVDFNEPIPPPL